MTSSKSNFNRRYLNCKYKMSYWDHNAVNGKANTMNNYKKINNPINYKNHQTKNAKIYKI